MDPREVAGLNIKTNNNVPHQAGNKTVLGLLVESNGL
jgi:hypothetical protein